MSLFRSFLFVPGDRPERFVKAVQSGADAVCIDLEDAVASDRKDVARATAFGFLSDHRDGRVSVGVRFNAVALEEGALDCDAFLKSDAAPGFILLPKVRCADEIRKSKKAFGSRSNIWALMETPDALFDIRAIATEIGAEGGIVFGGADFSAAIGAEMTFEALYYARAGLIAGAAGTGCQILDVPYLNVRDLEGLEAETRRTKALGFTGRSAIHPNQIAPINAVYTPTMGEVEKAKSIIAAYEANEGRVLLHEGRLVEKPVLAAAQRVLARRRD